MKTLKKILKTAAVVGLATGTLVATCMIGKYLKGPGPETFTSFQGLGRSHTGLARMVCDSYHKGTRRIAADRDIDGDNMNDHYVICNDGTAYNTMSKRLIQGQDSRSQMLWTRNTVENVEKSPKGDYDAL